MPRNYLVTGGAGFIGANYAARLIQRGENVTIYDNLSRGGAPRNLEWLKSTLGEGSFSLLVGDVRAADKIAQAARTADVIVHLAGQVAVTTSVSDPRDDFESNAVGTFNTLEAARISGRNPIFLYASTNKVYGGMEDVALLEEPTRWRYQDLVDGCPESQPLDFHSPYGCCYSEDTEILTRAGWKKFYELRGDDEVLTYNIEKGIAEYQRPTGHFTYRYQGKMYVQHHQRLQTCVTPNHKMLVASDCNHSELKNPQLLEAREIQGRPAAYLLAATVLDGETRDCIILPAAQAGRQYFPAREIRMDDWLRFLGSFLAEAQAEPAEQREDCAAPFTAEDRRQKARGHMPAAGLLPRVEHPQLVAPAPQLYEYVKQFGKGHNQHIPREIVELSPKHLQILLRALLAGDGGQVGRDNWQYISASRQLADDVQEIALKCGMSASVCFDQHGLYRVEIYTTRTARCNLNGDQSEWRDYEGKIYCVEVPNSTVMVRQHGHAYFSGNSKGAGDQYVRDYARIYGLRSVVFRQSAIYGPRQFGIEDQGWMAWFVIAAVMGRPITIYGDGKQVRDMLYVDDLLNAYDRAVQKIDTVKGQVFNMGGGPRNTISVWAEFSPLLEKLLGQKLEVARGGWRPGDQRVFYADIRKAERELDWRPEIGVPEGVMRLFAWVQANRHLF